MFEMKRKYAIFVAKKKHVTRTMAICVEHYPWLESEEWREARNSWRDFGFDDVSAEEIIDDGIGSDTKVSLPPWRTWGC